MDDEYWMRRALELARLGIGQTSPNPPVGAVIVQDGRELGSGYHKGAGQAHAEIEAFRAARRSSSVVVAGATLYVTLEPCSTRGRTGACTDAIQREKIGRVVYGATDPNPAHQGHAASLLEESGIPTTSGVLQTECEQLIRAFRKVQCTGLPWIIAKTAMSLDGRITRPPEEGQWLSNESSRADVQRIRAEADAILTSGATVRDDNPRLTVRGPALVSGKDQPWRVILTSSENGVPEDSAILNDEFADRTLIFAGRLLENVFRELVQEREVSTILVEAGGRLLGRLMDEGWIDELIVYLAPLVTGGPSVAVAGEGVADLAQRVGMSDISVEQFGSDVRIRGLIQTTANPLER